MQKLQKWCIEHMLYPWMETHRGNRILENLRRLQDLEQASPETRQAAQSAALQELLVRCAQHVPAYRKLGWTEEEIRSDPYGVLKRAPALKKSDFRDRTDEFLTEGIDSSSRIPNLTGGSTGSPLHFQMDRAQVETYEAARWRGLSWFGVTPGSRSVMVWGSPVELGKAKQKRYLLQEQLLKNRRILSAYDLRPEKAPEYVKFLNRYRPEYLYGYATALYALACFLEPLAGQLRIRLKVVASTSETLFPWQQEKIAKVFSCPVANEYGARDAGILAYSCPCGGLHVTSENALIEILDPVTNEPVPDGSLGVIAVTDLHNRVQPRLRYLLGDYGALSTKACSCGRPMPLLERLEGREDALLVCRDGQLVHGNVVNQLIRRYQGIRQFRLIQHNRQQATLLLLMEPDAALEEKVRKEVEGVLPGISVRTELVDDIPPAASGKARYTIREFPLDAKENGGI